MHARVLTQRTPSPRTRARAPRWDEWYGSSRYAHAPSLLLHAVTTLGFYIPFVAYAEWALYRGPRAFLLLAAAQLLTPLPRLSAWALGGAASRFVTRLRIWDRLRADLLITYAAPGQAGAFAADPGRRYIFCYQPMGAQARGAWYTFAGKGRASPVAPLADCKLAVSWEVMALPVSQQVHTLYGCCDSSFKTLAGLLARKVRGGGAARACEPACLHAGPPCSRCAAMQRPPCERPSSCRATTHAASRPPCQAPTSVCIPIGGFREAAHLGTYGVVTACRRGFARLALASGAALVPVIGVGEPLIACPAPANKLLLFLKAMLP